MARQLFYDRLLADFAEHPRTVVLSTHLIDEVADLLEHVVVLDRGRVALDAPADEVRGAAMTVSGPATVVEEFVAGWYGLVFRRWSMPGLVAFIAAQVLVILAAVVVVSITDNWPAVGHFFVTLTAPALTGVLAALAVALGLGGFTSIRRVTV
ncbi:MAG TPA: hypothetical protein VGQ26_09420 [Streptosporangiaceae bacterium]|nr:hypothetical protein [Streptosporangiaceae bacterium]